jgi:DNA helicase-2/ATP-dependent DNA helicase PcrA
MTNDLLNGLNAAQLAAVTHQGGPLLIVAGAGTGKTTVITRRIAWLIDQGLAKPEEILALTFTDKAAGEMEERVDRLLPYGYVDLWIQTFHAFGERLLRTHGLDIGLSTSFRLLSRTEQWMLLRRHFRALDLNYYRPLGNPTKFLDALLVHFSRAEDELVTPEEYAAHVKALRLGNDTEVPNEEGARLEEIANAFHVYKRLLRENNALDFSDLINETLRLFHARPHILETYRKKFKFLLVDEFQDTNWAQYELVKLMAGTERNITVVGDDDQSVYKFRGASVSNILDFERDFSGCTRVVLTENYRSKQEILDFAYTFIQQNNPDRLEARLTGVSKRLLSTRGTGGVIRHLHGKTLQDEARLVIQTIQRAKAQNAELTWNDFAILVRANDYAEPFLTALRIAGIPHEFLASRGLYHKPLILDILAYLRLLDTYHESTAVYRLLCSPIAELPPQQLMLLTQHASRKSLSLFETVRVAATIQQITEETVATCNAFVGWVEKHTALVRTKPVQLVILAFLNETGYLRAVAKKSEAQVREDMRILNAFWRVVDAFAHEEPEPTVRHFLERVECELEAGETGALPIDPESGPELVRVMTMHAAKGLEYAHVFLVNLVDKRFPTIERKDAIPLPDVFIKEQLPCGDAHLEEERRLFYVGCTRAKDALYCSSAEEYGGTRKKKLSRFLTESKIDLAPPQHTELVMEIERDQRNLSPLAIPERMSFSQFEAFEKCPLQYKFEHLYRIPKEGNANKSFGQSLHATLQEMLLRYQARQASGQPTLFGAVASTSQKKVGELVDAEEVLEIYKEKWIDDWYDSKAAQQERFAKGREALLLYHAKIKDRVLSIHGLEEGFSLKLADVTIRGRIDRVDFLPEGGVEIIDYKSGRAKEDPEKTQLLIYQLAAVRVLGLKPKKLTFVYLEAGTEVSFLGTGEELAEAEAHLSEVAQKIRTSTFLPTPAKDVCRFCDFRDICESAIR